MGEVDFTKDDLKKEIRRIRCFSISFIHKEIGEFLIYRECFSILICEIERR